MLGLKRIAGIIGLLAVIFLLFGSSKVFADTSVGSSLTTSPISVDLSALPGTSVSTTLQVQNNTDAPATVHVRLELFKALGDNGAAQIYPAPEGTPSINWVHFSQTSFSIEPNVWAPVTMEINLPKTAAYGYYYAVLFSLGTPSSSSSTIIKSSNAILVLLNASVSGEKNSLEVQSFTSDQSVYQYLPASFSITVKNIGNVFTIPQGDIYISRTKNGQPINVLDINSTEGNILPGTSRVFGAKWSNGFPVFEPKRLNGKIVTNSKGKPVEVINWDINHLANFRFGKYYAHLVLVYEDNGRDFPINASVSFWVIPWFLLAILILLLALVALGLWTVSKPLIRRIKNKVNHKPTIEKVELVDTDEEQTSDKKT